MLDIDAIPEMFARLEGCGLPTTRDTDGHSRTYGYGVWDPDKELAHKREMQREYAQTPEWKSYISTWRANNKDKINASERRRRAERKAAA